MSDGFESGDFSHASGGTWNSAEKVTVSSSVARTGSYAAKFHFPGNTDLAADAWAELRFDLAKLNTEVWFQYDLYIPSNFKHRNPSGPGNDKFLRLWGTIYDDVEKVGLSTFPNNGYSSISGEWNDKVLGLTNGGGMTAYPPSSSNAITASDVGTWVTYKIYAKQSTSSSNGTLKLWKNGTLILDATNKINNYTSSETHAFRYGYILGWSNSGYDQDTDFYLDNVVIATQESDLPGTKAPMPPVLTAQ